MKKFILILAALTLLIPAGGALAQQDFIPLGQSERSADELFATQRGYVHPYLAITTEFTDNLFNDRTNKEDYILTWSPGIWLAFPGLIEPALNVNTANTAVGGLPLDRLGKTSDREFQAYLNYGAEISQHKKYSEEDVTTQRLEASAMGAFAEGLTFELFDVYRRSYEQFGIGVTSGQSKFDSNLLGLEVVIATFNRLGFVLDYTNFLLDYDDVADAFRNRTDRNYGVRIEYHDGGRTTPFVEYRYVDVGYDTLTTSDSTQQQWFGGARWDLTGKTGGLFKVGYGAKNGKTAGNNQATWLASLQLDYSISPKTKIDLSATRSLRETDILGAGKILHHDLSLAYTQKLAQKLTASIDLGWAQDDYSNPITVGTQTAARVDDYFNTRLAFGYAFKKWFDLSFAYEFEKRDSNFNTFSYDNNTFSMSFSGTL